MATISTTPKPTYVYDGATDTWYPVGGIAQANIKIFEFTATAGQTSFSGNDNNTNPLQYLPNALIVTLNGVALTPGEDYTATTGSTIVLASGAAENDVLLVTAFSTFSIAQSYTKTEVDALLDTHGPMGGSDNNRVFYENSQTITATYTITAGHNASSTGPIGIGSGVTVTVPTGSVWSIV